MATTIQSSLAATTAAATTANGTPVTNPSANVDTNTFLKLLIAQMQNQDPTNPTDSTQWMAQMAQFTTVEQITNVGKTDSATQALQLLGKNVDYSSGSGTGTLSGTVENVSLAASGPMLTISGKPGIALSDLTDVSLTGGTSTTGA